MAEKSKAAQEREAANRAKDQLVERDSYTAKQVAIRCGTDAKTLRKFLRSNHSTAEAVGQGGRYEFEADQLPLIKAEFAAWRKKADARKSSPAIVTEPIPPRPTPKPSNNQRKPVSPPPEELSSEDFDVFRDFVEPTLEELEALENGADEDDD